MRIVVSQALGEAGPSESQPALVDWHWYYHVPSLGVWMLIVLLLVVPKGNRNPQAWLILIPLLLVMTLWQMPVRLLSLPSSAAEWFGFFVISGAMAWSVVWLLGHWLAGRRWAVPFFGLAVVLAIGTLSYFCHFGTADTDSLVPLLIVFGSGAVVLVLAMMLSADCCRHEYRPGRFMGWLLLWISVVPMVPIVICAASIAVLSTGKLAMFIPIQAVISCLVLAGILYLINLPFMILAFNSPFYRNRFHAIFGLKQGASCLEKQRDESPRHDAPVSTDPTTKPVGVEDVAGRWQFYLDDAASTVIVDFQPDGTFAQAIVADQGGLKDCPGGTWTLQGPMIHLTGYVTAGSGTSQSRTWWMIDTSSGLAAFGGDGSDPKSFFRMTRMPRSIA